MARTMKRGVGSAARAVVMVSIVASVAHAQRYDATNLGVPIGASTLIEVRASGVNDAGEVCGTITEGGVFTAFRWSTADGLTLLDGLGGDESDAVAINAAGQIVGSARTAGNRLEAFRLTPGSGSTAVLAGVGTGSLATAIADDGTVVGIVNGAGNPAETSGFRTTAGGFVELRGLDDRNARALAIAPDGSVTVGTGVLAGGDSQLLEWDGTTPTDIVPGSQSDNRLVPVAVDNDGVITGVITIGGQSRAFVLDGDSVSVGSDAAEPLDANASGRIVGTFAPNGNDRAFVADDVDALTDLNDLVDGGVGGFVLTQATGVADSGLIVAVGRNASGDVRSFLLTPIAEPTATVASAATAIPTETPATNGGNGMPATMGCCGPGGGALLLALPMAALMVGVGRRR